jgi:hypothetical protein
MYKGGMKFSVLSVVVRTIGKTPTLLIKSISSLGSIFTSSLGFIIAYPEAVLKIPYWDRPPSGLCNPDGGRLLTHKLYEFFISFFQFKLEL